MAAYGAWKKRGGDVSPAVSGNACGLLLVGLRVPVSLSWEIEKRLWIVPKDTPDPPFYGDVDLTEISD